MKSAVAALSRMSPIIIVVLNAPIKLFSLMSIFKYFYSGVVNVGCKVLNIVASL